LIIGRDCEESRSYLCIKHVSESIVTRSEQPRTLAVIPARGGSKRIDKKNIREIGGKPLIAHTIEHANKSERITNSVVSTEDEEIKAIAREYSGSVPFDRPESLATDTAETASVVSHAIDWYEEHGESFDVICLLQVTTPLRRPTDIDQALTLLEQRDCRSVISTTAYGDPPHWAVTTNEHGYLTKYFDRDQNEGATRSQDLPTLHHANGAVFAATMSSWRETSEFFTDQTLEYQMPPRRSLDIDEPWELDLARCLYESDK